MDEKLFRTLLYQSEGPDLDFKREQYVFKGGDELKKSKLLKDILTFANSFRLGDAHILIGVVELGDGRREARGIPPGDHIDDASLQQFVNSKTNREVKFSCEAFLCDGNSFGIITIPKQKRPIYLNEDFGIVKSGEVYFRRGSSSAIATLDDIYQMGLDDAKQNRPTPIIRLQLADIKRRLILGTSTRLKPTVHEKHKKEDYPDATSSARNFVEHLSGFVNRNYWRELADYARVRRAFVPVGLAAINDSGELAKNVHLEISQGKDDGPIFMEVESLPRFPKYNGLASPGDYINSMLNSPRNRPNVLDHGDRWTLLVDFGDIQPTATAWASWPIYVAAGAQSAHCTLAAKIYADNLTKPQEAEIELHFDIDKRPALTLEELRQVQDQYWREIEKEF